MVVYVVVVFCALFTSFVVSDCYLTAITTKIVDCYYFVSSLYSVESASVWGAVEGVPPASPVSVVGSWVSVLLLLVHKVVPAIGHDPVHSSYGEHSPPEISPTGRVVFDWVVILSRCWWYHCDSRAAVVVVVR